jgi:signal transduction histidine kinase
MEAAENFAATPVSFGLHSRQALRLCFFLFAAIVLLALAASLLFAKGYWLATFADLLQVTIVSAAAVIALQNCKRSQSFARGFWFTILVGASMWVASLLLWAVYEIVLQRPVPEIPFSDMLLFLKLVPFTAAVALQPKKPQDARFRTFGILDVTILMLFSLYLYAYFVYAYHPLPDGRDLYNFQFNIADAIGHQVFVWAAAFALLRSRGSWRYLFWAYFLAAAFYAVGSDLCNVAIDLNRYYSGSPYDVPLSASSAALLCVAVLGRAIIRDQKPVAAADAAPETDVVPAKRDVFLSSHAAMLVTLCIPVLGLWLLSGNPRASQLFTFRLEITFLTIFLLLLLLSIKEDLLTTSLVISLKRLSDTYSSIDRLKNYLIQGGKLASLGELVAHVANQIKSAMTRILDFSACIVAHPSSEPRIHAMAGKITQYARRTDSLVENMLRFAQETPLQLTSVEIKPLLESALQLSRIGSLPNLQVSLSQEGVCPNVRGDSSQLLHVFLQLIANAADALEQVEKGEFRISIHAVSNQLHIQFADSGPGLQHPERVFEPFYTTKPVGKGTGLGLSTCYGILQQHQGEILCRNRAEGGALFTVILPAVISSEAATKDVSSAVVEGAL